MSRNYYKAVNIETGEERCVQIPPAVQVISRRKLADVLDGDVRLGFYAAVYGSIEPDHMHAVATGTLDPDAFVEKLTEWLWTWEPDIAVVYNEDGTPQDADEDDGEDEQADPLP